MGPGWSSTHFSELLYPESNDENPFSLMRYNRPCFNFRTKQPVGLAFREFLLLNPFNISPHQPLRGQRCRLRDLKGRRLAEFNVSLHR